MYIITGENNVIFHISKTLDYQTNGNLLVDHGKLAISKELVKGIFEVEEVPNEIEVQKYCYTAEQSFYKNEGYQEYYSIEDRISALEDAMNILLGF